jgi:Ca2+-binding EF-hand superfamily protein
MDSQLPESQDKYKHDMENVFTKEANPIDFINALKGDEYRQYIQKKYQLIIGSFQNIDKDKNQFIDVNEILEVLDKNLVFNL